MIRRLVFFIRIFLWFNLRGIRKHPGRALTVLLGIALGAAVFTSVRLSINASLNAFTKSVDLISGQSDLVVTRPGGYVPEDLIAPLLRHPSVQQASPILTTYVHLDRQDATPFLLVGMDPILDRPLRSWRMLQTNQAMQATWSALLGLPYSMMISATLAQELDITQGDSLKLIHAWQQKTFEVIGILAPEGLALAEGGRIGLIDIATFQEFTGLYGNVDRIDLKLGTASKIATLKDIRRLLPKTVDLNPASTTRETGTGMIRAYQLNLSVLSFASLFVGMFLVYSLVALNAASRRQELAVLRSIGASSRFLLLIFLGEGALFGVVGWLVGIPLSNLLVTYILDGVSQTISTLFIRIHVETLTLDTWEILLSFVLTVFVCVMAAFQPAWKARQVSPKEAMEISQVGGRSHASRGTWAIAGLIGVLLVWPLSQLPAIEGIPIFGYFSIMLIFSGFSLMIPWVFKHAGRFFAPLLLKYAGVPAYLAGRYIRDSGTRTAVSVGALITAVALFAALVIMVHSFRQTVAFWTHQTIQGDLFVTTKMGDIHRFRHPIPDDALQQLQDYGQMIEIIANRRYFLSFHTFPYEFELMDLAGFRRHGSFLWLKGNTPDNISKLLQGEGVVISEVFANRSGLSVGDNYQAQIDQSRVTLPIVGIVRDYRTHGGVVFYSLPHFSERYHPIRWTGLRIFLRDRNQDIAAAVDDLRSELIQKLGDQIDILDGNRLRAAILRIFDETFAITTVLLLIALFIAALGIATTLTVLVLERSVQLNTLLAVGGSAGQIHSMIFWEAVFLVVLGEAAGLISGFILSWILIYVINLQSFGWTFLYGIDWGALGLSIPLIIFTALGAAMPAVKLVFRQSPATVLTRISH